MTRGAIVTESAGNMIGIRGCVERARMTVPAGGVGKPLVHVVHMAEVTGNSLVSPNQLKRRRRMAERRRGPHGRGMARVAGVTEIAQDMVRVGRLCISSGVARIAISKV